MEGPQDSCYLSVQFKKMYLWRSYFRFQYFLPSNTCQFLKRIETRLNIQIDYLLHFVVIYIYVLVRSKKYNSTSRKTILTAFQPITKLTLKQTKNTCFVVK